MTCTEVMARLRKPPTTRYDRAGYAAELYALPHQPGDDDRDGVSRDGPEAETGEREEVELVASRHPRPDEMEAYERVLTDAMAGDATLVCAAGLCGRGVADRRSGAEGGALRFIRTSRIRGGRCRTTRIFSRLAGGMFLWRRSLRIFGW